MRWSLRHMDLVDAFARSQVSIIQRGMWRLRKKTLNMGKIELLGCMKLWRPISWHTLMPIIEIFKIYILLSSFSFAFSLFPLSPPLSCFMVVKLYYKIVYIKGFFFLNVERGFVFYQEELPKDIYFKTLLFTLIANWTNILNLQRKAKTFQVFAIWKTGQVLGEVQFPFTLRSKCNS